MIKPWKKLAIIFPISAVLIALGLVVGILWASIYTSFLHAQLSLAPASQNYELWKETPIPMYLKIHMFNLTNPEALIYGNGTPHFVEMGPYVFKEVDYKVHLVLHTNDTITFERQRIWHFDESLSKGSLSDKVTNINPVTATIAYTLRFKQRFLKDLVDRIMRSIEQKLVVTRTVNELLFEGFNDTMLNLARKLKLSDMPFERFAWFFGRNGSASYDGIFNMNTGTSNILELGAIKKWNYNDRVSYYPGECGKVGGTNGDLWPPLPNNKTISFFVSDICTKLEATYYNTTEYKGLTGVKYINDEKMLDDGSKVPSRKCYCVGECIPPGALNVSLCKWGAPAFISSPHFYLADPSYRVNLSGLDPQKEKHQITISLEPKTGVPLSVHAQLQLNLLLLQDDTLTAFKNVKRMFVPMLWFSQDAYLTSALASKIKLILILESLGSVTFYGIAAIGFLLFFIGIFLWIREGWKDEENQILLPRQEFDTNTVN